MPWWSLPMGCRWPSPTAGPNRVAGSSCRASQVLAVRVAGCHQRYVACQSDLRGFAVPRARRASSAWWRRPSGVARPAWRSAMVVEHRDSPSVPSLLGQDGKGKAPDRASGFSPYVGSPGPYLLGELPSRSTGGAQVSACWRPLARSGRACGPGRRRRAAVDTELGQDPGDMDADCLAADEQLLGDLPIGATLLQQCQHLQFPRGQPTVTPRMWGAHSQVQPTSAGQPLQRPLKRLGIESHRGLVGSHGRRGRFCPVASTNSAWAPPLA